MHIADLYTDQRLILILESIYEPAREIYLHVAYASSERSVEPVQKHRLSKTRADLTTVHILRVQLL